MNNKIYNTVREILLKEWDPFCIGENPNLADEYDAFIPQILRSLDQASFDAVSTCLVKIEKELHATVADEQRNKAVRALLAQIS